MACMGKAIEKQEKASERKKCEQAERAQHMARSSAW